MLSAYRARRTRMRRHHGGGRPGHRCLASRQTAGSDSPVIGNVRRRPDQYTFGDHAVGSPEASTLTSQTINRRRPGIEKPTHTEEFDMTAALDPGRPFTGNERELLENTPGPQPQGTCPSC